MQPERKPKSHYRTTPAKISLLSFWAQTSQLTSLTLDTRHQRLYYSSLENHISLQPSSPENVYVVVSAPHIALFQMKVSPGCMWIAEVRLLDCSLDVYIGGGCQKMMKIQVWEICIMDFFMACHRSTHSFVLKILLDSTRSSFNCKYPLKRQLLKSYKT